MSAMGGMMHMMPMMGGMGGMMPGRGQVHAVGVQACPAPPLPQRCPAAGGCDGYALLCAPPASRGAGMAPGFKPPPPPGGPPIKNE